MNRTININTPLKEKIHGFTIVVFILWVCVINLLALSANAQQIVPVQEARLTGYDLIKNEWNRLAEQPDRKWLPELTINQGNNSSYKEILDSLYETNNQGYSTQKYRWYFYHNSFNRLDSSKRLYYNVNGQYQNITETRTYNPDGQVRKMVLVQPFYTYANPTTDSIMHTSAINDYIYDTVGNLVKQRDISFYSNGYDTLIFSSDTSYSYYTYDSKNRKLNTVTYDTENYYYNGDNLKYHTFFIYGVYYRVDKYDYSSTDTSSVITEYHDFFQDNRSAQIDLDTISNWTVIDVYTERYDTLGRVISLIHREPFSKFTFPWIDEYKADYTYATGNNLLHASYYTWGTPQDTAAWYEAMRIDNTYDNMGNRTDYRKTYRDVRIGKWEVQAENKYYYSTVPVVEAVKNTTVNELNIYPDPAHNSVTIGGIRNEVSRYVIYTLYGEAVQSGQLNDQEINISQRRQGIYILEIRNERSVFSGKFVKY